MKIKTWDDKKKKYTKKKVKPTKVIWLHKNNYQVIKMVGKDYSVAVGNIPYMTDKTLHDRYMSTNRERYLNTGVGAKLMLEGHERYIEKERQILWRKLRK